MRALRFGKLAQEGRVTTSDDSQISEDRREALRYALAIGSGAALASSLVSPASAQAGCVLRGTDLAKNCYDGV